MARAGHGLVLDCPPVGHQVYCSPSQVTVLLLHEWLRYARPLSAWVYSSLCTAMLFVALLSPGKQ